MEQILSGELEEPPDYRQDQDEWVVVLSGSATLDVDGERLELGAGDWVLLPAGTPHRLARTERGTTWLAVHLHPDKGSGSVVPPASESGHSRGDGSGRSGGPTA